MESLIIKPKRSKGEDDYKVFSIRIKEDVVKKIDEIADQTGHSRNELIGIFLKYALDHCVVDNTETSEEIETEEIEE